MIKGQAHEEVEEAMKAYVMAYIASLPQVDVSAN
jgi:hypothetical protein